MPVREYRIAPEYRRCCWYTIFGTVFLTGLANWLGIVLMKRDPVENVLLSILFLPFAGAVIVPLRWRLRVGQEGMSRKLVWGWDEWNWSDLASGRIQKHNSFTLRDPDRPRWRRKLTLDFLDVADRQQLIAELNIHYRLPPAQDVPDRVKFRLGFRRLATLDGDGIHLNVGRKAHEYRWPEVRSVLLTRSEPLRRDFTRLRISLQDQEIELRHPQEYEHSGQTSENICALLVRHVPPEKFEITIEGEPLTKREHVERELQRMQKQRREFWWAIGVCSCLLAVLFVGMAVTSSILKALVPTGIFVVCYGPIIIFMDRAARERVQKLKGSLPPAIEGEAARSQSPAKAAF